MNRKYALHLLFFALLLLNGCDQKDKKESNTESSMKCGAGKCGSSMANGSALLVKKKMNILNQLKPDDNRRDCVLKAKTTKEVYTCVRAEKTGRLSTKCATNKTQKVPKKSLSVIK